MPSSSTNGSPNGGPGHRTADFLIAGAGIIGLSLARELKKRYPESKIVVLEKESGLGRHSSGRNSGVLHSGIYYPVGSLKGRVCAEGAREMTAYCEERGLPIERTGKVIVPTHEDEDGQLDLLHERGRSNGARVEIIDEDRLKELEPEARTATGRALYSPDTAVIDSGAILERLSLELREGGVEVLTGRRLESVDPDKRSVRVGGETFEYGHLFNSAGLHADRVAWACGVGERYTMLPFKGIYWRLTESSGLRIRHLIYPVPDLNVPFLGVHFTKKVGGGVYLGPTAVPAFGRENYAGLAGVDAKEIGPILFGLLGQYRKNSQGFRRYAHEEGSRFFKARFAAAARALAPNLKAEHLQKSDKVGIRAQLLDRKRGELVMDFLVEHGENSTHVLNAVSPAFTSAFSFSRLVVDEAGVA